MKNFLLIIFFLLFSSSGFAQAIRHTSFDDRSVCEDDRGTWREYGNSCIDLCEAKLDRFMICAQAITYGCQCGKGRCWDGSHCALMKDYKKNYDEEYAKEQEKLKEARKAREDEYEENSQKILKSLLAKSVTSAQQQGDNNQQAAQPQSNISDFYKPEDFSQAPQPAPPQNSFVTKINNSISHIGQNQKAPQNAQQVPAQAQQPASAGQSATISVQPTQEQLNQMPFYQKQAMEQDIEKRKADQSAAKEDAATKVDDAKKDQDKPASKSEDGLVFPVLPLPTN